MGGTGDTPVPSGHWPDGTGRTLLLETDVKKVRAPSPIPSGESPPGNRPVACATAEMAVAASVFGFNAETQRTRRAAEFDRQTRTLFGVSSPDSSPCRSASSAPLRLSWFALFIITHGAPAGRIPPMVPASNSFSSGSKLPWVWARARNRPASLVSPAARSRTP